MKISKRQLTKLIREQSDFEYSDEDYENDPEYAENEDTPSDYE